MPATGKIYVFSQPFTIHKIKHFKNIRYYADRIDIESELFTASRASRLILIVFNENISNRKENTEIFNVEYLDKFGIFNFIRLT